MTATFSVSPSQLVAYRACPLKWWLRYVRRLPEIKRNRRTLGDRVHAAIEAHLTGEPSDDDDPEALAILERAKHLLRPAPAAIEWRINQAVSDGIVLGGKIDALYDDPDEIGVHDHKTFAASGERYLCKGRPGTINWIGDDPQMLAYAAALAEADGYRRPVRVRHNQIPTETGLRPRAVEAVLSPERLRVEWANLQAEALMMQALAHPDTKVEDVGHVHYSRPCERCDFVGMCGSDETQEQYVQRAAEHPLDDGEVFG